MSARGRHAAFALVAWAAAGALVIASNQANEPAEWIPFQHDPHVHNSWLAVDRGKWKYDEVGRDCRGCHRYGDDAKERGGNGDIDPQDMCGECHRTRSGTGGAMEVMPKKPAAAKARRAQNQFDGVFRHEDHTGGDSKLPCRTCHLDGAQPGVEPGDLAGIAIPNRMAIPRGLAWCATCHDATNTKRDKSTGQPDGDRFAKKLNENPKMHASSGARFRHADHLTAVEMSDGTACLECHGTLANATEQSLGVRGVRFAEPTESGCAGCHIKGVDAGKPAPVTFEMGEERVASKARWTFSHARHLSDSARTKSLADPNKDRVIATQGCLACHRAVAPAPREGPDWRGGPELWSYNEACADACHFHASDPVWAPIPDDGSLRKGRPIPDHGDLRECRDCHTLEAPKDKEVALDVAMKTDRPVASVTRTKGDRFFFVSHKHPYITPATGDTESEALVNQCGECHRAGATELPSRIRPREFRHETHLPAAPSNGDCVRCHGAVAATKASQEVEQVYGGRLYDEKACKECHRAGVQVVPATAAPAAAAVVWFPHERHVGKQIDGGEVGCGTCHVFDPAQSGQPERMGYYQHVTDCTKCHDHTERRAAITSGRSTEYIVSCGRCHSQAVPVPGAELMVDRVTISGTKDAQYHPGPGEAAALVKGEAAGLCASCHRDAAGPLRFEMPAARERVTELPANTKSIYGRPTYAKKNFHERTFLGRDEIDKENCLGCHWNALSDPEKRPRGLSSDAAVRSNGKFDSAYPGLPPASK